MPNNTASSYDCNSELILGIVRFSHKWQYFADAWIPDVLVNVITSYVRVGTSREVVSSLPLTGWLAMSAAAANAYLHMAHLFAAAALIASQPVRPQNWWSCQAWSYLVKMATSKNTLTLHKKYEVLEMFKKNPLMSVCKLAEHFACRKSQIASILLKSKESTLELYELNLPSETIRSRKRSHTSEFCWCQWGSS